MKRCLKADESEHKKQTPTTPKNRGQKQQKKHGKKELKRK